MKIWIDNEAKVEVKLMWTKTKPNKARQFYIYIIKSLRKLDNLFRKQFYNFENFEDFNIIKKNY